VAALDLESGQFLVTHGDVVALAGWKVTFSLSLAAGDRATEHVTSDSSR
jgi:hypothetical protein